MRLLKGFGEGFGSREAPKNFFSGKGKRLGYKKQPPIEQKKLFPEREKKSKFKNQTPREQTDR